MTAPSATGLPHPLEAGDHENGRNADIDNLSTSLASVSVAPEVSPTASAPDDLSSSTNRSLDEQAKQVQQRDVHVTALTAIANTICAHQSGTGYFFP